MTRALIIGGGIAGPVTAMALQRAGIEAVIYEAYPADAPVAGAFLTVAVNGIDALRTLDLDRPVLEAGFPTHRIAFVSGTGKRLGEMPIGGTLPDGTATQTIMRPDLYRVLSIEARRRGIPIEHGKRLVHAEPMQEGGVVARFADGTEATGDFLVGADGIHSRTRVIIDPAAPPPRYTRLGNVGGCARVPGLATTPGQYVMLFGSRAFFGCVPSPSGEIWWFANPPTPVPLSREELSATARKQWKERLIELFARDTGPAAEIINATEGVVLGTNTYDMPRVPVWHIGPRIIIGDAAHAASPSSGQGASLAIEDGVMLARCLRDLGEPRPGVRRLRSTAPAARRARGRLRRAVLERQGDRRVRANGARPHPAGGSPIRRAAVPGMALRLSH